MPDLNIYFFSIFSLRILSHIPFFASALATMHGVFGSFVGCDRQDNDLIYDDPSI